VVQRLVHIGDDVEAVEDMQRCLPQIPSAAGAAGAYWLQIKMFGLPFAVSN
jgi:hypothetical protein